MEPDAITPDVVHTALRAVRHGNSLDDSPLLRLGSLRERLRAAGTVDSPEARAAELARYLDDVVGERLAATRGLEGSAGGPRPTPEEALERLDEDFAAGGFGREAWGLLHLRFLTASPPRVRRITRRLAVSIPTLTRRTERGYALLAEEPRRREEAAPASPRHDIPHPPTRFIGRGSEIGEVRRLVAEHGW